MEAKHVLTILAVENLPLSSDFYGRGLGWTQVVDTPVYHEFILPAGMRLGLYERTAFGRNTGRVPVKGGPGSLTPTELYLHVDRIDVAIEALIGVGARLLSPLAPRDWGDEAAYFADPDGNVIVLARPLVPTDAGTERIP